MLRLTVTVAVSPLRIIDGVTDVVTEAEGAAAKSESVTGAVVMVGDGVGMGDSVVDVSVDDEATRIGVKIGGCAIGVYWIVVSPRRITIVIPGTGVEVDSAVLAGAAVIVVMTAISV